MVVHVHNDLQLRRGSTLVDGNNTRKTSLNWDGRHRASSENAP